MNIYYGILEDKIDVTSICTEKLKHNNTITIPQGDENRSAFFTDPLKGIKKFIYIELNKEITEYNDKFRIKINTVDHTIVLIDENEVNCKLEQIHSTLKINHGTLEDELPE